MSSTGLKISKRVCIGETTLEQAQTHLNAKRKTIKMLMFVVAVFAICWLPYHVMFMLEDFFDINFTLSFQYAIKWLAMSSICYNPFIYFWLNNGYRQGILNALTCCGCTGTVGTAMTLNSSIVNANNAHQLHGCGARGASGASGAHVSNSMIRSSSARSTLSNLANGAATLCQQKQQTSDRQTLYRDDNNNNNNINNTNNNNNSNNIDQNKQFTTFQSSKGSNHHLQIIYISLQENCGNSHQAEDDDDDGIDSDIEERPPRSERQMGEIENKTEQHFEELIELVKQTQGQC